MQGLSHANIAPTTRARSVVQPMAPGAGAPHTGPLTDSEKGQLIHKLSTWLTESDGALVSERKQTFDQALQAIERGERVALVDKVPDLHLPGFTFGPNSTMEGLRHEIGRVQARLTAAQQHLSIVESMYPTTTAAIDLQRSVALELAKTGQSVSPSPLERAKLTAAEVDIYDGRAKVKSLHSEIEELLGLLAVQEGIEQAGLA
ncbi:MAG: hypothetical protein H7255_11980 [Ramlibacter sp.]|nr:hypothetical protein [Ramlibacter sp.]